MIPPSASDSNTCFIYIRRQPPIVLRLGWLRSGLSIRLARSEGGPPGRLQAIADPLLTSEIIGERYEEQLRPPEQVLGEIIAYRIRCDAPRYIQRLVA
jgi:hypothetical protein